MSYTVDLSRVEEAPGIVGAFGRWVAEQEHGSLGWFDVYGVTDIEPALVPAAAKRLLDGEGFAFMRLPTGSQLAVVETGDAAAPRIVVHLGAEGETQMVAPSFEGFLHALASAKTQLSDLDDEERPALAGWLEEHEVASPPTGEFQFELWLAGDDVRPLPAPKPRAMAVRSRRCRPRSPTSCRSSGGAPTSRSWSSVCGANSTRSRRACFCATGSPMSMRARAGASP